MKLWVRGHSRALSREEVRYLIQWAGETLLGRCDPYVKIVIRLRDQMEDGDKGTCEILDELHRPREFRITALNKGRKASQISTLFHEMVHVKQWVKGEMRDYAPETNMCRWKKRIIDRDKIKYEDEPWEKEAYRMERTLYRRYIKHLKKEEISFD